VINLAICWRDNKEMAMKIIKIYCVLSALAILISGCSTKMQAADVPASETSGYIAESSETEITTASAAKETEPFKYNPHLHTSLISEVFREEWWGSFYNMCDAMREGKDSFECIDEECFKICTNEVFIGNFFPAACTLVSGDGYEDGVGRLKYKMDKEKFIERQAAFETEVERMLNEAIRTDYSEFEKVMGLYDYICKNFRYDYEPLDGQDIDDFSDYACLTKKNGICCELAGAYAFLLLQSGVDAICFEGTGDAGYHGWTYVVVGGKGYHCDPTWGLCGGFPDVKTDLQFFMLTEQERIDNGFDKESIMPSLIWPFVEEVKSVYPASDTMFKPLHEYCRYVAMDTGRNVVIYVNADYNRIEFSYGDL